MAKLPDYMQSDPLEFNKSEVGVHIQNIENMLKKIPKKPPAEDKPQETEFLTEEKPVQSPKWFIWDIETYKNDDLPELYKEFWLNDVQHKGLKDPLKIEANRKMHADKMALGSRTGRIILSGFLDSDNMHTHIDGVPEKRIIRETWKKMQSYMSNGYRMITFNGKGFDFPFLFERTLISGLLPEVEPMNYPAITHQYSHWHLDLNSILPGSLAEFAYLMEESESWVSDGGNIGKYYEEKRFDLIIKKNFDDLYLTKVIAEKILKWFPYQSGW